ncbi:MAG: DUF177 domain-containing protein [bacterium]
MPPGPQIFDQESAASRYVGGNDIFPQDLWIRATLEREPDVLKVFLEVEAEASFSCDRCNDCFTRKHLCTGTIYYAFDDGEDFSTEPEQTLLPRNATEIDLAQDIRDLLILELPTKVLCDEECKGLCLNCGANLNREACSCQDKPSDPRWDALKKLRNKSTE